MNTIEFESLFELKSTILGTVYDYLDNTHCIYIANSVGKAWAGSTLIIAGKGYSIQRLQLYEWNGHSAYNGVTRTFKRIAPFFRRIPCILMRLICQRSKHRVGYSSCAAVGNTCFGFHQTFCPSHINPSRVSDA